MVTLKQQVKSKTPTCAAVGSRLGDGLLQVGQPDLLSVPSSLPVLQSRSVDHLLSCGAAARKTGEQAEDDHDSETIKK